MNLRYIPAAITPVTLKDCIQSIFQQKSIDIFEDKLSQYFQAEDTCTFTSLMRTNYACFSGLKMQSQKRTVLLPRYSCPSFAHGILAAGLTIKYCDVEPNTLSYKLDALLSIEPSDILAIVCANLFGFTNPSDQIMEFCENNNIYLIEGVDYGIGTELYGKKIGTFGHLTILNFQEGKALPIGGGAVVYNKKNLAVDKRQFDTKSSNLVTMLLFSIASRPFFYNIFRSAIKILNINAKKFSMEDTIRDTQKEYDYSFDENEPIHRLSAFQGSLGNSLMSALEDNITVRSNIAHIYMEKLKDVKGISLIQPEEGVEKIHFIRYPILVNASYRNKVLDKLLENKIEASPMYIEHGMDIDEHRFPGAYKVMNELLTLPCHPYVQEHDLNRCINIIKGVLKNAEDRGEI